MNLANPLKQKAKVSKCQNTIWRYHKNNFINAKGELVYSERISYLKKKSCEFKCQPSNRCCESDWLVDEVREFLARCDLLPEITQSAHDGCLLKLNYSVYDPEDGVECLWFDYYSEEEKQ